MLQLIAAAVARAEVLGELAHVQGMATRGSSVTSIAPRTGSGRRCSLHSTGATSFRQAKGKSDSTALRHSSFKTGITEPVCKRCSQPPRKAMGSKRKSSILS